MTAKTSIGIVLGLILVLGAGYIVYMGRPVMKMADPAAAPSTSLPPAIATSTTNTTTTASATDATTMPSVPKKTATSTASAPTPAPEPAPNTYTLADVQTHNNPSSCWSVISGNVYDLTTWISRHPGGSRSIEGLCGIDGTARFERKHGGSSAARAALTLLKIGTLR